MRVDPSTLAEMRRLYEQGLCLQAYRLAEPYGPLHLWKGADARIIAGRIAANLGGPGLQQWLHLQAWRTDREHPLARYYYIRTVLERRGPLAAWRLLRKFGDVPDAGPQLRSDWLAFAGYVAGQLRDFDTAEYWHVQAAALFPENPWIFVERSSLLESQDRYDDALAAARRSLEIRPWYRPGVQATAHLLQLMGRDREALELLLEASRKVESGPLVAQLVLLQAELDQYQEAWESLDHFEKLCPLLGKEYRNWLGSQRSELAYLLGDRQRAIQEAQALAEESPFHKAVAERMATADAEARRVKHNVAFVRQHHNTCAPATLAAISGFWEKQADHLAMVEEICYGGTPSHRQRAWAEANGWAVRQFRVTWESAVALLDRGVPFTLTTVQTANAHLQAVVGYDDGRGTLLIRDPYRRHVAEFPVEPLLEDQRSTGPRGMAMVPTEHAELLQGIDLPDTALYDHQHTLQSALAKHDRTTAQRAFETLLTLAPEHLLSLEARRILASYDANSKQELECVEKLLERYPKDENLQLNRLRLLGELGTREERLRTLKEICGRKESDPLFWWMYAHELSADARQLPEVDRLLRHALRRRPADPRLLLEAGHTLRSQRRWDEALELYRFAACVEDESEHYSQTYFQAAQHLHRLQHVVQFLEGRFKRFGKQSGQPARTLFWALTALNQTQRAFEVLEEGLRLRPEEEDENPLILFAVSQFGHFGRFQRAQELLSAAHGRSPEVAWLQAAAELAQLKGDLPVALSLCRQVLELDPLLIDVHYQVIHLLKQVESSEAAQRHCAAAVSRFPYNSLLYRCWETALEDDDSAGRETVLRKLLSINPTDQQAHWRLASELSAQRRYDEALAEAREAYQLDPCDPYCYLVLGGICEKQGDLPRARSAYRQALQFSVEATANIYGLVRSCHTQAEKRAELQFVEGEIARQAIFGEGLMAYREVAREVLTPDELLTSVWRALQARPDVWETWVTATAQLRDMERYEQAAQLAQQSTERFPLIADVWLELGMVHGARMDREQERAALRKALELRPGWTDAVSQLCRSHELAGEWEASKALLQAALFRNPLHTGLRAGHADALWHLGRREEALAELKEALNLAPGHVWARDTLANWSEELNRPWEAVEMARSLVRRRPGDPHAWMLLSQVLTEPDQLDERLAALDKALELNPRFVEAYDQRARLLAEAERYEEALASCHPSVLTPLPLELRTRAAWVELCRGNLDSAIGLTQLIVLEAPNFRPAWHQLALWFDSLERNPEYARAAAELVRLDPQDASGHAMLGDARLRMGDRYGAKAAFHQALSLQPDFEFAGLSLFSVQLEDHELLAAAHTLNTLRQHTNSEWIVFRGVQLAVKQKDVHSALERFRELCFFPLEEDSLLKAAAEMLDEAEWGQWVEQTYTWAIRQPGVHPRIGELWVEAQIAKSDWSCEQHLPALAQLGAVGACAAGGFAEALADAKSFDRLKRFLYENQDLLRSHDRSWAMGGYAYLEMEDFPGAVNWMADWKTRPGVRAWMLIYLVNALRAMGRDHGAAEVSRRILETESSSNAAAAHAIWLALDAGLEGQSEELVNRLHGVNPDEMPPFYGFLYLIARAIREVQTSTPATRAAGFNEAKRLIDLARNAYPPFKTNILLKRYFPLAVKRVAADAGGFGATAWQTAQLLR